MWVWLEGPGRWYSTAGQGPVQPAGVRESQSHSNHPWPSWQSDSRTVSRAYINWLLVSGSFLTAQAYMYIHCRIKLQQLFFDYQGDNLYVGTYTRVYKFSVADCGRHLNCGDCIGSRDPYCYWDKMNGCMRHNLGTVGSETDIPFNIEGYVIPLSALLALCVMVIIIYFFLFPAVL